MPESVGTPARPMAGGAEAAVQLAVAQQARLAAETRLGAFLDSAPDAIVTADSDGRITMVNPRVKALFGYEGVELLVASLTLLIPERYRDAHSAALARVVQVGKSTLAGHPIELSGLRKDGSEFPLELSLAMYTTGGVTSYSGIIRDISARKRAEAALAAQYQEADRSRREAGAVLDASSDAMLLMAPDGRLLTVNRRAKELFSLPIDNSPQATLQEFETHLERIFGTSAIYERIVADLASARGATSMDLRQQWPVQRDLHAYSTAVHRSDGFGIGHLFVVRDVTKEREADRLKTEIVSLVSHELRTPLTSIKGYIDLLAAGDVGALSADQMEFLGIAKANADRLVVLINNLLDVSRIEAGKVELRRSPLALGRLLRQVVASMRPQLEAQRQALTLVAADDLPMIEGDADRLTQVFTNLLSNATKYTPPGGKIWITARQVNTVVQVEVVDNGIGLTPQELDHLFTKLFRSGHRLVREADGTGLGLTICRSLVELHGGQLTVFSRPGVGSTFTVRLPSSGHALPLAFPERKPSRAVAGSRILVVDDEPNISQLIRRYLERGGYQVEIARSGNEAWRIVREAPPDLITLDISLPDIDGFTVMEWLKNDPMLAAIPVEFLTMVSDEGRGIRLGAIDYLTKPCKKMCS